MASHQAREARLLQAVEERLGLRDAHRRQLGLDSGALPAAVPEGGARLGREGRRSDAEWRAYEAPPSLVGGLACLRAGGSSTAP